MEQKFIHREVKEELNCAANRTGNGNRRVFTDITGEEVNQRRRKPSREANERDGEHDVNGQRHRNVCAGIEGLFYHDLTRKRLLIVVTLYIQI